MNSNILQATLHRLSSPIVPGSLGGVSSQYPVTLQRPFRLPQWSPAACALSYCVLPPPLSEFEATVYRLVGLFLASLRSDGLEQQTRRTATTEHTGRAAPAVPPGSLPPVGRVYRPAVVDLVDPAAAHENMRTAVATASRKPACRPVRHGSLSLPSDF